jgi:hypothetical protein
MGGSRGSSFLDESARRNNTQKIMSSAGIAQEKQYSCQADCIFAK